MDGGNYGWSYAEVIASNMQQIFDSVDAPNTDKAVALYLAAKAAAYKNRFAAMDTCTAMVKSVQDDDLGMHVASVLIRESVTFLSGIEPSDCRNHLIRNALRQVRRTPEGS